jgi:hypothetical protein
MKAIRIHERGGPEVLIYEDAPRPRLMPGDALVRVYASAITKDELTWDPTYQTANGEPRTPSIPGHEFSGVVEELAPEADSSPPSGTAPPSRSRHCGQIAKLPVLSRGRQPERRPSMSVFQPRSRFDQHMLERGPQRQNTVIRRQMSAESSVTLIRVAIEPDVLGEKMLECLLKRAGPVRCC